MVCCLLLLPDRGNFLACVTYIITSSVVPLLDQQVFHTIDRLPVLSLHIFAIVTWLTGHFEVGAAGKLLVAAFEAPVIAIVKLSWAIAMQPVWCCLHAIMSKHQCVSMQCIYVSQTRSPICCNFPVWSALLLHGVCTSHVLLLVVFSQAINLAGPAGLRLL